MVVLFFATLQHASDGYHLLQAFDRHAVTRTWLAAAVLYCTTLAVGLLHLAALRRRDPWTVSRRWRTAFWTVRLTVLHALRSVIYTVAGMQVPSLLGRALVTSVAFGLLGLPADTFLRAMPIKIIVVYSLSCVKDPSRLSLVPLLVSCVTYFLSATLAYTAAAATVGRAKVSHSAPGCAARLRGDSVGGKSTP